jgi:hypothetical protein
VHALDVRDQARRELIGGQHLVDDASRDRAARHAVEFRVLRCLGKQEAAGRVDRHRAAGAVRAGPREHDADAALAVGLGERGEEDVDRQRELMRALRAQVEAPVGDAHQRARRNEIDVVRRDRQAMLGEHDRHLRVPGEQIAHHALVVRREVLDDHEHCARVGAAVVEEVFEGFEAARGRAYAYDIAVEGRDLRRGRRFGRRGIVDFHAALVVAQGPGARTVSGPGLAGNPRTLGQAFLRRLISRKLPGRGPSCQYVFLCRVCACVAITRTKPAHRRPERKMNPPHSEVSACPPP